MQSSPTTRAVVPVVAAVAANVVVLAAGSAADASFVVARGDAPMEIGVAAVVIATALPLVIGLVVTALAVRRWPGAAGRLRIAAIIFTIVSLAAPLTADTDTTTRLSLALMHIVTGAAYVVATLNDGAAGRRERGRGRPAEAAPHRG